MYQPQSIGSWLAWRFSVRRSLTKSSGRNENKGSFQLLLLLVVVYSHLLQALSDDSQCLYLLYQGGEQLLLIHQLRRTRLNSLVGASFMVGRMPGIADGDILGIGSHHGIFSTVVSSSLA